jgi:hypothetical protein
VTHMSTSDVGYMVLACMPQIRMVSNLLRTGCACLVALFTAGGRPAGVAPLLREHGRPSGGSHIGREEVPTNLGHYVGLQAAALAATAMTQGSGKGGVMVSA